MQLDQQLAIVTLTALVYSSIIIFMGHKTRSSKSNRVRLLWKSVILDGFLFIVGLLPLALALPQAVLHVISWIVYNLIISYVLAIEIPGYFKLSKYDETSVKSLKALRKNLLKMRYSFEKLEDLKTVMKENAGVLSEEQVGDLLQDFVDFCDRMENLDRNLWELTLNEITEAINKLSQRSKHPIPKLIDVLSLAGLSFLMAQILKILT